MPTSPLHSARQTLIKARASRRATARLRLLRLAARGLALTIEPPRQPVERVVLLRPDHVGDVLLSAPAVALMRDSMPAAQLTYIVGPWSLEAARGGPVVDHLLSLAYPGFSRARNANVLAPYALLAREAAHLRRERFDLALVLRPDHWWGALLALAAGIPLRVGGDTPETAALLTHRLPRAPGRHAVEQSLELARWALRAAGVKPAEMVNQPSFAIGEAARRAAEEFWVTHGLAGKRVVVLQPGAGAVLKSWPIEHWAQLAEAIVKEETSVVLAGAPADLSILREIEERVTSATIVIACGQPLDVSAAIYARCALLVGPDSGAAHLAAAMGTPTVRLYGPAPPDTFGPWPPHGDQRVLVTRDLPCVPCGHLESPPCGATTLPACMLALSVADVLKAVRAQMGQG